jgi:hypothetical protein
MEKNEENLQKKEQNEKEEQKIIENDKNNVEPDTLKKSELNNTEKDLKNGVSQDIPNMYTPIPSHNATAKLNNKLENEKVDEENEIKENEEQKDQHKDDKEKNNDILDKEKSAEIKMFKKSEEHKDINDDSIIVDEDILNMDNQPSIKKKEEKEITPKKGKENEQQKAEPVGHMNNNIKYKPNNNDYLNYQSNNIPYNQEQNVNVNEENNVNNYNYVYDQETNTFIPIITVKDLQNNPKEKMLINSPYSLKALYDSGYTMDELQFRTLDEFVNEHKEVIHIDEDAKMNRYNFYEQLRLDKINHLVEYREKILKEEQEKGTKKVEEKNNMKNIIIDNHIRIAKEEIDVLQKKYEKELANIIELELDKDLFNLEIIKQEENYNKEYEKLNFLNLNNDDEENDNDNENINFAQQEQDKNNRYTMNSNMNNLTNSQNIRSLSSRRKNTQMLNEHNTYLDNLYSLQQAKVNQKYAKNQKKNEKKLERVEKVNKIKGEQMALKKRIEVERAAQNLLKNAIDYQNRHENLIKEIQMKNLLIYQNKKRFDNYLQEKKEWNHLKYMVKLDHIASLKRKDENIRQLNYEKLLEKQSKRERIKLDRMDVFDSKKLKMFYLNSERKRNIIKIKNILDSGIDEENLHKILMAFPGNKEIDKVIENYKNQKELIQAGEKTKRSYDIRQRPKSQGKLLFRSLNKSYRKNHKIKANDISYKKNQQNFKIPNVLTTANKKQEEDKKNSNKELLTEDNKIYYESEIREKIKQFKENLYREFFRHVEDEKRNENLRNKQLENVHDPRKKHELEKRFSKERALVDLRLKRENQNIEEKVKTYEINLRQNNINNHNLYFKKKKNKNK